MRPLPKYFNFLPVSALMTACSMGGNGAIPPAMPITIEFSGAPESYAGKSIYIELTCKGTFFYLGSSAWASGTIGNDGRTAMMASILIDKDTHDEIRKPDAWNAPEGAETTLDVFIDGDDDGKLTTADVDIADTDRLVGIINMRGCIPLSFSDLIKVVIE